MEKEFICILHSDTECGSRGYKRECDAKVRSPFASVKCPYRIETLVIAAAKQEDSPENVVQQPQQSMPSDFVDGVDQ